MTSYLNLGFLRLIELLFNAIIVEVIANFSYFSYTQNFTNKNVFIVRNKHVRKQTYEKWCDYINYMFLKTIENVLITFERFNSMFYMF